jgi:hypothetical protein
MHRENVSSLAPVRRPHPPRHNRCQLGFQVLFSAEGGRRPPRAIPFSAVAQDPSADLALTDLSGYEATLASRLMMFNQLSVVIDPYTHQSGWILPTAARLFNHYSEADIRCVFVVASDADGARQYLGRYADEYLVLLDPDRVLIGSLDLEFLPALVHLRQDASLAGAAEGWQPAQWLKVLDGVEKTMAWHSQPQLPAKGDPAPFVGTPV